MILKRVLRIYIIGIILSIYIYADISGIVFRDLPVDGNKLNRYGIMDSNELGVKGIKVTAYPENISTITDNNGSWSLATTKDSRVEFSNLPPFLKESVNSNMENSSVKFVKNGSSNVNFGIYNPDDFSDTINPLYVSNLQQNGTHVGSMLQSLYTVYYEAKGLNANYSINGHQGSGEIPQDTITMEDIGSVWGKAYQKSKKRLFISSMLQRHMGFANSPADIYVTSYKSIPANLLGNFSLQGKKPANGGPNIDLGTVDRSSDSNHILYDNPTTPNIDFDAYAKVGKISYGGIDVDEQNSKLWLVNLNQKGLISVDISGDFDSLKSAKVNQYLIENLSNSPTCNGGYLRPWALKIHDGKGYLGAICDGSISKNRDDMYAYILSFDLNQTEKGFNQVVSFPLNYKRQIRDWYAWEDSYFDPTHPKAYLGIIYGEPVLSDIEFDKYDNLYVAFFDRYATQLGHNNYKAILGTKEFEGTHEYGEILKICNNNGVYQREGTGECTKYNYTDLNISEFFNDQGGDRNRESSIGALAILKGSNELLLSILDPHPESTTGQNLKDYWFTQGVETLSLSNGSIKNWYSYAVTANDGLNGKMNGMGDIELITSNAPTEIGDRVWLDANGNGIQDINESGIKGVDIELICDTNIIAKTTTDANGYYIFSISDSDISKIDFLAKDLNCSVKIPNITGDSKQSVLGENILTLSYSGEGDNPNLNDSNGIAVGKDAETKITSDIIPTFGANNHSIDFGFKPKYIVNDTNSSEDNNNSNSENNNSNSGNNNGDNNNSNSESNNGDNSNSNFEDNNGDDDTIDNISTSNYTSTNSQSNNNERVDRNITIGDRVWLDADRDGIQDRSEIGIANILVSLYQQDCTTLIKRDTTDNNGYYLFENINDGNYCIKFSNITDTYEVTQANIGNNDLLDSDVNPVTMSINIDSREWLNDRNLSFDLGLVPIKHDKNESCDLEVFDDNIKSNSNSRITSINVLENDCENIDTNRVKVLFVDIEQGERLWRSGETLGDKNITIIGTRFEVEGEGIWTIDNGIITFTPYSDFNGVPTPVYYIVQSEDNGKKSNIARVSIETSCCCKEYKHSIATLNYLGIFTLLFMMNVVIIIFFKDKIN